MEVYRSLENPMHRQCFQFTETTNMMEHNPVEKRDCRQIPIGILKYEYEI